VLMPFLCWCHCLLHVGASTFPMLVVVFIMHLWCYPFRIGVVVHFMLVFLFLSLTCVIALLMLC
jgi:hypothetical protein